MKPVNQPPVKSRRKFDETFKREAVNNWLSSGKSAAVIGQELGLAANRLYAWRSRFAPADAGGRAAAGAKPGSPADLQARLEAALREVRHLREQFFKVKQEGKTVRRGPYFVLQRWLGGKNLCERVAADQVEPVRQGVEGYKRFRQLADEFVDVCEAITLQSGGLPAVRKKRWGPPPRNWAGKPPGS
jgi:transposase-like protein